MLYQLGRRTLKIRLVGSIHQRTAVTSLIVLLHKMNGPLVDGSLYSILLRIEEQSHPSLPRQPTKAMRRFFQVRSTDIALQQTLHGLPSRSSELQRNEVSLFC